MSLLRPGRRGRRALADIGTTHTRRIAATTWRGVRSSPTWPDRERRIPSSLDHAVNEGHDLAGYVRNIHDAAAVVDLPVAALLAELAYGLDLMIPALHVALREMPAAGIDRKPPVEAQAALPDK